MNLIRGLIGKIMNLIEKISGRRDLEQRKLEFLKSVQGNGVSDHQELLELMWKAQLFQDQIDLLNDMIFMQDQKIQKLIKET